MPLKSADLLHRSAEDKSDYLLAVWEGIWTAFLLESLVEARLGLHPLAYIVDHPNGQALRTLHLQLCNFLTPTLSLSTKKHATMTLSESLLR